MGNGEKNSIFNILYWNIHFAGAYKGGFEKINDYYSYFLEDASLIVKYLINKSIQHHKQIDAIILTEAYPQVNNKTYNCILKDFFQQNDYDVFQSNQNEIEKGLEIDFNPVLIATKKEYNFKCEKNKTSNTNDGIESLILKSDNNVTICGFRAHSQKGIEVIKDLIKDYEKLIMLGDFNAQYKKLITDKFWENKLHKCKRGTNFDDSYIDNLFLKGYAMNDFDREFLMEEEYHRMRRFDLINKSPNHYSVSFTPYPDHNLLFASVDLGSD